MTNPDNLYSLYDRLTKKKTPRENEASFSNDKCEMGSILDIHDESHLMRNPTEAEMQRFLWKMEKLIGPLTEL